MEYTWYIQTIYLIGVPDDVHTCIYICRNVCTCMYMFMFFKYCTYHVCQLLYYIMVCTWYRHGTDMSVHVYARSRWSGFQMPVCWRLISHLRAHTTIIAVSQLLKIGMRNPDIIRNNSKNN
jgi:hypothetical protein